MGPAGDRGDAVSDWRRRWQRYRRQNRFLIALYVLVLALAGGAYALFSRMAGLPVEELTNRLLIFLLWWFDLTLIVVLLFILLRNFVKLALERRYGMLGSRFRTKLLLSYVGLILGPSALVFVLSASLLSRAAASWFSAPVEGMAGAGVTLAEGLRRQTEARVSRTVESLAREVEAAPGEAVRIEVLERLHGLLGSQSTSWWRNGTPLLELLDPRERALQRLGGLDLDDGTGRGVRTERAGGTLVVRAWHRLGDGSLLIVGEALPGDLMAAQARLAVAGAAYERLKLDRPTMTATVVLGFGALALMVAFAAIWLGLYLSRRFTAPLLALAATTQRIAGGDSLEEVPLPAEDEVGLLVGSFNAMVRRLRQREEELSATVRRLDTVLGAVRTGVLSLDAERCRVAGNPAAAALLAMPELVNSEQPLSALDEVGLGGLADRIRAADGASRGGLTIYPQGVARQVEVAIVPLGAAPGPTGWVVALEDLTQLLRAQRQAAWSEVAKRLAHQIKNPLTPIRLAAERIARQFERGSAELGEIVPASCHAIVEHVQVMQDLVDAFSRFAKLPPTARRPVAIGELAAQVVALYQGVRPGLEVRLNDRTDGMLVALDPDQLRQVLTNLIDNAIEASDGGGLVTVTAGADSSEWVLTVDDDGHGLGTTDPELFFQPFFSTRGRGSGVGLAIIQRIVTDHGGVVRLLPREPRGTRAEIRIPAETA